MTYYPLPKSGKLLVRFKIDVHPIISVSVFKDLFIDEEVRD